MNHFSKSLQFTGVLLIALLLLLTACDPTTPSTPEPDSLELTRASVEPNTVRDAPFPPVQPNFSRELNDDTGPYLVPEGPERLDEQLNPATAIKELLEFDPGAITQDPIVYREYDEIDDAPGHPTCPEPSVAENGQTVMHAGNFWMSLSLDGGATFTTINPTSVFPEDYGGFCCDQVLQYVPQFDMFVWLLQYRTDDGVNAIRIAIQTTAEVRSSNGTSWTYWDFTNTALASSGTLDYNDMSFGRTFLYWTSSINGGQNRYVVRVPLEELAAKGTVNYQFTQATNAYWSHVTQGGQNGVYWAGHVNNSTLLVYSMMDGDDFYSWREVNINSWPSNTMSSIAADGDDWLSDASWKTYVRAAAVHDNSIYFAWNAANNSTFPHPHIQIVEINRNTFSLVDQFQVWNGDFAFAYPYFETNAEGELGMIVAFGGGPYDASSGVGVWGDFVIYYPRLSSNSQTKYGHYHTARRSGSDANQWVGAGYTYEADGSILPYYVRFSR